MEKNQDGLSYAEKELLDQRVGIFTVFSIDGGRDLFPAIEEETTQFYAPKEKDFVKLAAVGDKTYYSWTGMSKNILYTGDMTEYFKKFMKEHPDFDAIGAGLIPADNWDPSFVEEYYTLMELMPSILANGEYYAPVPEYSELIGLKLDFVTTDHHGNHVLAAELFAQHEITVLNLWASWCPPCIQELPALQAMSTRLAEKDCAIVGLLVEGDNPSELSEADHVLGLYGIDYLNLIPPENWEAHPLHVINTIPATLFVNRDGVILTAPFLGPQTEKYEETVNQILSGQ